MFITIEGIDGSGKSTQSLMIARWLEDRTGREIVRTFEPGGWPDGKTLREFILSNGNLCAMSELLLFLADRAEHLHRVIVPSLEAGHHVICERYNDSTLAYQAGGHKLEFQQAMKLIEACEFPEPDVKILLNISPELAMSRIKSRTPDKFESEGLELMKDVAAFYMSHSEEYLTINCDGLSEHEVFSLIISGLEEIICQSR